MADMPRSPDLADVPEAHVEPKKRWTFQVVWLIPIVSALIGGWLAVKAVLDRGPTITITFQTAEGLEPGKTKLKYKDVEVGLVKEVSFTKDLKRVEATAELVKQATPYLVEDTRFWVVRPRISGGTVSGLGTLLSGSYIAVDVGRSKQSRRHYAGLDTPPVVSVDTPGRQFVLRTPSLASIDTGSPVFFRRLQAGQVVSYALDDDGKGVTVKIFVNAPYDKYVNANTRFWNASGIDVKIDANGIDVQTESFISILIGGIAFETPEGDAPPDAATAETRFELFHNRLSAMKNPENDGVKVAFLFDESARGLTVGAPVDFRGLAIGEVTGIHVDIDSRTRQIIVPVDVLLYPSRLRASSRGGALAAERNKAESRVFMDTLVSKGLRGQLRTGSLLTGQLYIALDFFPKAPKAEVKWAAVPIELPTTPGARQELQAALASVASKIDRFPLDELGKDARTVFASADRLLKNVDSDVTPDLRKALQSGAQLMQRLDSEVVGETRTTLIEARKAMLSADKLLAAESPLQQDTRDAMREISRAAYAFRILADYLERNPQALLMGKKEDAP